MAKNREVAETSARAVEPVGQVAPEADQPSSRREWLALAGAAAVGVCLPRPASAAMASVDAPKAGAIDQTIRVPAKRLDALVAEAFKGFNVPVVLPEFNAARHGARYDVELHRLVAPFTIPETGEKVTISGLLALPVGVPGPVPVVSWQHGTVIGYEGVPTSLLSLRDPSYVTAYPRDSLETLFNVQRFSGQGYAVIAADYVGKGPFRKGRGEAYAVKEATTQTCVRMLDVGLAAMQSKKVAAGPLFLNGWSQGGLNTQWLHQELRRLRRPIAATAVQSPFNDLVESFRFWGGAQAFPLPEGVASYPAMPDWISLCMIIALGSYELNYGIKGLLQSAIRPEFRALVAKFWSDYDLNFDPAKPFPSGKTLLVPGFFDRFTDERNSEFLRCAASNVVNVHRYDSPIRFYHGLVDEALHPVMISRALALGGGQALGVPVAGGSHRVNFLAALYGDASSLAGKENAVDWFNSLRR